MDKEGCIFCRIIAGKAPADVYYRDDDVIAFRDIHPVAPVHILIVPVKHIDSINELTEEQREIAGELLVVAAKLAKQFNIDQNGYRLIINTGKHGGQVVQHLHVHLIGGQRMRFPIG